MRFFLTKTFRFSASYAEGGQVFGHNYVLGVSVESVSSQDEKHLIRVVEESLIEKVSSKDLGLHVEFLNNTPINDENLLKAFWKIIEPLLRPLTLRELYLERDSRTRASIHP